MAIFLHVLGPLDKDDWEVERGWLWFAFWYSDG